MAALRRDFAPAAACLALRPPGTDAIDSWPLISAVTVLSAPTPLELAELILLATGVVALVATGVVVTVDRRWSGLMRLPRREHDLQPADLLAAIFVFFLMPALFLAFVGRAPAAVPASGPSSASAPASRSSVQEGDTTTQPASAPSGETVAVHWTASELACQLAARLVGIVVLSAIGWRAFGGSLRGWGLRFDRIGLEFGIALAAYVAFWPVCVGLVSLTEWLIRAWNPAYAFEMHESLLMLRDPAASRAVIVSTVAMSLIVAPVIEEMFFRGILLNSLARWTRSPWAAVLISGALFGAVHAALPQTVPSLALFGIVLGYLYVRTGSLTLSILLHMVFNGKTLLWLAMGAVE